MTCLEFNILLVYARFCLGAKNCVSFNCRQFISDKCNF